ncbi:hypothetical protein MAR_032917 [Mya arenaria]|uniref:VWFA domain-containing protein n=1 Tax=Mya arenaria TaxID=6604 RepID=A0ABY7G8D8_MYAAR|nr:hypothetical protein MAR_032917 [Mya arenaria]
MACLQIEKETTGGGTSFSSVLNTIIIRIHLSKIVGSQRAGHGTNKALFLITDGEQTVKERDSLNHKLILLKEEGYELFTVGIGRNINKLMLKEIASEPTKDHIFLIRKFNDLKYIGDILSSTFNVSEGHIILKKTKDYGKCGISGSTEITEGTDNSKKITVNLGDSRLYQGDDEQVMPIVKGVNIHPNYTGVPNEHDIRDYDVAILDFGEDDRTQPPLNKYSLERLKSSKVLDGEAHGFTVGWGLSPSFTRQLPWVKQKQNRREIQSDFICGRQYPDLDTDRYFCVGNIRKEGDSCRGDIGGAYMAELRAKRYSAFGIAQRTYDCQEHRHFSIFLDLHHPSITEWALPILGRCNRLGSAEDEEKEAEKERAQKKTEETNLLKKAG